MAWEFVDLAPTIPSSTCNSTHLTYAGLFSGGTLPDDFTRNLVTQAEFNASVSPNTWLSGDSNLGLFYTGAYIQLFKNGSIPQSAQIECRWDWGFSGAKNRLFIGAIDREREVGTLISYNRYYGFADDALQAPPYNDVYNGITGNVQAFYESNDIYTLLLGLIPVLYTWQSVPAISGKNGTLSLTKILNINDGEPVQDITNKGNLDFSKKTKVNTLVSSVYEPTHKEDQTKATVEYDIPDKTYAYCKLVYKKDEIPISVEDGTAIPIDPDGEEISISGLEERTTYYFVIFTNKTTSEPYRFRTGKNEAPEGIFKMKITTVQGIKENGIKEVITITQQ